MDATIPKIGRHGFAGNFPDCPIRKARFLKLEPSEIGREEYDSVGVDVIGQFAQQLGMIPLDIPIAGRSLAVGEGRRIDNHEIELFVGRQTFEERKDV